MGCFIAEAPYAQGHSLYTDIQLDILTPTPHNTVDKPPNPASTLASRTMSFASSSGSRHDWIGNRSGQTSAGPPVVASPRPASSGVSRPSPQWPWGSNRSVNSTQSFISPAPTPSPSRSLPPTEEPQWTTQSSIGLRAEALTRQWTFSVMLALSLSLSLIHI